MYFFFLYLSIILKIRDMYSLNCDYYDREFETIDELVDDVISSGMDPNYIIMYNGVGTGSMVIDFIQF
jgi:hypothetical protein